jgi:hypothetical protein
MCSAKVIVKVILLLGLLLLLPPEEEEEEEIIIMVIMSFFKIFHRNTFLYPYVLYEKSLCVIWNFLWEKWH